MNEVAFQQKMARLILRTNLVIFLVFGLGNVPFYRLFADSEDALAVLKLLLPISSLYMAAVIKYLIKNKHVPKEEEIPSDSLLTKGYVGLARAIIYSHMIIINGLIIAYYIKPYGIDSLTTAITVVEGFFGAYVGTILTDLFKDPPKPEPKEEEKKEKEEAKKDSAEVKKASE